MTQFEWHELFRKYRPLIERKLMKNGATREMAEDATSDSFIKLSNHADRMTLTDEKSRKNWLIRVATRQLIDNVRQNSRFTHLEQALETPSRLDNEDVTILELARLDEARKLWAAINLLPASTRRLVTEHAFEEKTFVEISKNTTLTPTGCKSRWYRARGDLRILLAPHFT